MSIEDIVSIVFCSILVAFIIFKNIYIMYISNKHENNLQKLIDNVKIDQIYYNKTLINSRILKNPFIDDDKAYLTCKFIIVDIKDGWVETQSLSNIFVDKHMPIKEVVERFKLLEE